MTLDDATRIRVIRALLGMSSRDFAARVGICGATLTGWERSRATPTPSKRQELAELCHEKGIAFSPSGMPFPWADMNFKPQEGKNG